MARIFYAPILVGMAALWLLLFFFLKRNTYYFLLGGMLGTIPAYFLGYYVWWFASNLVFYVLGGLGGWLFHPGPASVDTALKITGVVYLLGYWLVSLVAGWAGFFAGGWLGHRYALSSYRNAPPARTPLVLNPIKLISLAKLQRGGTFLLAGLLGGVPCAIVGIYVGSILEVILLLNIIGATTSPLPNGPPPHDLHGFDLGVPMVVGGFLYALGGFWVGMFACGALGFAGGVWIKNRLTRKRA